MKKINFEMEVKKRVKKTKKNNNITSKRDRNISNLLF